MFVKPFKSRANIQLKGSDKKRLKTRIFNSFPTLKEEQLNNVFCNKSTVCSIKGVTHNEENIIIYTIEKQPFFFEIENLEILLPTVYAVWKFLDIIPIFTTHSDVLPKLANGADLMLPGIVKSGNNLQSWGNLKKNEIVGINLTSNRAIIAVGLLAHSSYDLYMCGGRGVAVNVLHVFGDKLWGMEPTVSEQPPLLSPVVSFPAKEDFPPLNSVTMESKQVLTKNFLEIKEENDEEKTVKKDEVITETPDEILYQGFLNFLKVDGKKMQLPMLTSTFYPQCIQRNLLIPIDIKKTKYKKFSIFLKEMEKNNFLTIREEPKGVEKITSINLEHPEILKFMPKKIDQQSPQIENAPQLLLTKMTEIYVVTEKTAILFSNFNLSVGSKLDEKQIKDHVKDYVNRKKLLDKESNKVNVDDTIKNAVGEGMLEGKLSMDNIVKLIQANMQTSFEMRTQENASIKGGKKPIIHITTATRTGNKKVTIISNLDLYGINITEFAKAIKLAVAASTSMTEVPGYKTDQLLVQGNHVQFIYDLLVTSYKIPRGNITGLEFAKKEKKKKK
uniref:CSON005261 protein n=1 Tax=Culicoides sonorensis TaxID=179676 RepID=A0A336K476_CULSO